MSTFGLVVAVAATLTALSVGQAGTATAGSLLGNPGTITATGFRYAFENWDNDPSLPANDDWDNPVTIMFVSTQSNMVSRVYDEVQSVAGLTHSGNREYMQGDGPSRPGVADSAWSSFSAGRKGAYGCFGYGCSATIDLHLRTYGPDGQQGTQIYQGGTWPYYLIATTHEDRDENTAQQKFGWQDDARDFLVRYLTTHAYGGRAAAWRVVSTVSVGNTCGDGRTPVHHRDSQHNCQSNGKATIISIDG